MAEINCSSTIATIIILGEAALMIFLCFGSDTAFPEPYRLRDDVSRDDFRMTVFKSTARTRPSFGARTGFDFRFLFFSSHQLSLA